MKLPRICVFSKLCESLTWQLKFYLEEFFFLGGGALFLDLTEYIFANVEYGESSQEFISKAMPVMNL